MAALVARVLGGDLFLRIAWPTLPDTGYGVKLCYTAVGRDEECMVLLSGIG